MRRRGVRIALRSAAAATFLSLGSLAAPALAGAPAAAGSSAVPVGSAPRVTPYAHAAGAEARSAPVHVDMILRPRDQASLDAFVAAVSDPGSPYYHHFLGRGQFGARFGALPSTIATVVGVLRSLGLEPGPVSANGLDIPIDTTAGAVESAFGTRLERYVVDGRNGFANSSAPLVPGSIAPYVQAVSGLDTVDVPHPHLLHSTAASSAVTSTPAGIGPNTDSGSLSGPKGDSGSVDTPHTAGPVPCTEAKQAASQTGSWTADQIASAYGFASAYAAGRLGAGETVALYEEENYSPSDVTTFEQCYGISTPVTTINAGNPLPAGHGSGEAIMDIENVVELSPAVSVDVYEGNPGSGMRIWNKIVNDNIAEVVSTSWGICEQQIGASEVKAENTLFEQAASQGQTIVDASGDSGSEDCYFPPGSTDTALAVDDPGSQPDVTSVGGTSLTAITPAVSEKVWNNCLGKTISCARAGGGNGAGGGGVSRFWTMPAWQAGPGVQNAFTASSACPDNSGNGSTGSCREMPDVAALADPADGYVVYCKCGFGSAWAGGNGGTSAAAPVWAALVALADQACGSPSGLLNPTLYSLGATAASDFHDVTTGSNDFTGSHAGDYPATAGYDMATGWGTPTAALLQPGTLCGASPVSGKAGYWMLGSGGTVYNFGTARNFCANGTNRCGAAVTGPAAAMAAVPDGTGYWVVSKAGEIAASGSAPPLTSPQVPAGDSVVSIAATPTGKGLWLATNSGRVLIAGDATSFGDPSGTPLNSPIVDMAATPDGKGYWLLGGDGGVFTFGDAAFFGSTGNKVLNKPAVAMAPTADGNGYWFVASDGGMFAFGNATYYGSVYQLNPKLPAGGKNSVAPLNQPANGIVVTPDGKGYWMVAADGGVFTFGDAGFVGSLGGTSIPAPIVGFTPV